MATEVDQILEGAKETVARLREFPTPKLYQDWPDYSSLAANEKTIGLD